MKWRTINEAVIRYGTVNITWYGRRNTVMRFWAVMLAIDAENYCER